MDSGHTLLFHCYIGTPWVYVPERLYGVAAQAGGGAILLAITIAGIDAGPLRIREDDRLEHLVGDQSTVYDLSTANIT